MQSDDVEYAGFWIRVGAALIDSLLVTAVILPLLVAVYGWGYFGDQAPMIAGPADFLISWVAPAIAVVVFWLYRQATPGKMVLSLRVVDADTGGTLSVGQSIGRYLAYYVSMIPLLLGFIWVAFDRRKQGWHDKLAGTVVIRSKARGVEPVRFEPKR
ncbi:MAG TPA: RDD family protein [Burkholderiaceae bacterium]|nr:RDD family protein [Burkholderiaceae bacterium]